MRFADVTGQQHAKQGLLNMWKNNSFPHALLICGAEGTGGLPLALALAQFVFCENKQEFDSCGQCAGCSKAARLEHADLHLSFPSIPAKAGEKANSKVYMRNFREYILKHPYSNTFDWLQHIGAENKQGNITAEECRDIIESLYLRSYEGGKKVLIMWRPEYLGKEGNILLKLIEEPPQDTVMLFVAENRDAILQTIRSRTQEVRLTPVPAEVIADALVTQGITDERTAAQVAQLAAGSYSEALRLVNHTEDDVFQEVRQLFNVTMALGGMEIPALADKWGKAGREQQKNYLQYAIGLIEHTIRKTTMPGAPVALPDAEARFVQVLATKIPDAEKLYQLTGVLADTQRFIERNAHSKTQLHAMMLRMRHIRDGQPIIA